MGKGEYALNLKGKNKQIVTEIVQEEVNKQLRLLGLTNEEWQSLRLSNKGHWRLIIELN